jgi:hypothetical protein
MLSILLSGIGAANVLDGGSQVINLSLQSVALLGAIVIDRWASKNTTPL